MVEVYFTKRQEQIIEAVAEGLDNQQIADKLNITVSTVKNILTSVCNKLRSFIGDRSPRVMVLRYYLLVMKPNPALTNREG